MKKQLLNRKLYKDIKKYDRQQMEGFLKVLYQEGIQDGFKQGSSLSTEIDFKTELVQLLEGIKGIGGKTKEKILKAYKERMKK